MHALNNKVFLYNFFLLSGLSAQLWVWLGLNFNLFLGSALAGKVVAVLDIIRKTRISSRVALLRMHVP
jgi:hypothetical protein